MRSRPEVPAICPSVSSVSPASPSLHGVPSGPVPPLRRYCEMLRLPAARPGRLVASATGTARSLSSPPSAGASAPPGPGFYSPSSPSTGSAQRKRQDLPGSWRTSVACRARIVPGRLLGSGLSTLGCCLPPHGQTSAPAFGDFGVHTRGLRTRCLRFAAWVTPDPRKTRFRPVATLRRTGFSPARSVKEVSKIPAHSSQVISSPSSRLRLAHTWYLLRAGRADW